MPAKKIAGLILLNAVLAAVLVLCYSPGCLCLRPDDPGLLRAGMSVLVIVFAVAAFAGGNMAILKEKGYKAAENITDTAAAGRILEQYTKSRLFGNTAASALRQLSRLETLQGILPGVVGGCFEEGSLSHTKYMSIINDACSSLFANIEAMAKHINLFNEKDYWYLVKHYREDEVPDHIQEEQIRQYEEEAGFIKDRLAANEKVLVKLGELKNSLLAMGTGGHDRQQDAVLGDVARMAGELKFYAN